MLLPLVLLGILYARSSVEHLRGVIEFHPPTYPPDVRAVTGLRAPGLVSIDELPGHLIIALLLHEDDLFLVHRGLNLPEVLRRIKAFLKGADSLRGGSSISQQLVKNVLGESRRRPVIRWFEKIRELMWLIRLERTFTKREILTLYLNSLLFGPSPLVGIGQASRILIGKDSKDLTLSESVFLLGLVPRPLYRFWSIVHYRRLAEYPYRVAFIKCMDVYRLIACVWGWEMLTKTGSISARDAVEFMGERGQRQRPTLLPELELALETRAIKAVSEVRNIVQSLSESDHPTIGEILSRSSRMTAPSQLLVQLVRFHHGFFTRPRISLDAWPYVVELARRHHVPGCLQHGRELGIPESAMVVADTLLLKQAQIQLLARSRFETIAQALADSGVRLLVYKGFALQDSYYRPLFRMWADIDVVCAADDASLARKVLESKGFYLEPHSDSTFVGEGGMQIDLHTRLVEEYIAASPSFESLFERRRQIESTSFYTLDHVDHLLALLLHGFKHQWCRLQWLVDIALIVGQLEKRDFQVLEERARELRVLTIVHLGIFLVMKLFDIKGIPLELSHRRQNFLWSLSAPYKARLFRQIPNTSWNKGENSLLHLRALEGVAPRIRYIVGRVSNYFG